MVAGAGDCGQRRLRSGQRQSVAGMREYHHGFGSCGLDSIRGNSEAPFWILLSASGASQWTASVASGWERSSDNPSCWIICAGIRHERVEQHRQQSKDARRSVQHRVQLGLCFWQFRQFPGRAFVDVFIAEAIEFFDREQHIPELQGR